MTTIYFIRHAESDYSVRNSRIRPLTEKGMADRSLVTKFLNDKNIDIVLSSPYKRAVDTLKDFTDDIHKIEDFHEITSKFEKIPEEDFPTTMNRLWSDFDYKKRGGESLKECQNRNIAALEKALSEYKDQNIAIGTHGIALAAIVNYYDNAFHFDDFMHMSFIFPWVVKMTFDENKCTNIEKIDLFK